MHQKSALRPDLCRPPAVVGIGAKAVCLGILWKKRTIPTWLPILALLGELAGRAAFFSETVHTAINMGNPY